MHAVRRDDPVFHAFLLEFVFHVGGVRLGQVDEAHPMHGSEIGDICRFDGGVPGVHDSEIRIDQLGDPFGGPFSFAEGTDLEFPQE